MTVQEDLELAEADRYLLLDALYKIAEMARDAMGGERDETVVLGDINNFVLTIRDAFPDDRPN